MSGKKEFKLKPRQSVNIESRSEEAIARFSKWVHEQNNFSSSILSLVEHCIDRFGYEDVLQHDIAKKLHKEQLYFSNKEIAPQQTYTQVEKENKESFLNSDEPQVEELEAMDSVTEKKKNNSDTKNEKTTSNNINLKNF